jgi:hypothetical protein
MKTRLFCSTLLLFTCYLLKAQHQFTANETPPVSPDWYTMATKQIEAQDYAFVRAGDLTGYSAYNKTNGLSFRINKEGIIVSKSYNGEQAWKMEMTVLAVQKGNSQWLIDEPVVSLTNQTKIRFDHKHFSIEYANDKFGLRQNFIVNHKLPGNDLLQVNLSLDKDFFYAVNDDKLYCYHDQNRSNKPELLYDDLKVWDANGTLLPAHMQLNQHHLYLVVDDRNATYPVTIDPLSHSPEWTTSANGILPALLNNNQLQVDALYGYTVAGLGDVNGDGFDDVAIGAPAAIDIIAGPTTIVGAGAVFIYFGSVTGLPLTANKVLRATTPVTNAMFGYSIAGGNVTGNSRNDIIIGAPGDRYVAAVGGFPSTATVTAGKVYVFRGEDLTAGTPTPLLSVYLNGSSFFSRGVLGITGSNITTNALFGFSVAATEDMNGDGLGEIVVGAPGYAELGLVTVKSGAALVYYSNNLVSNTVIKLTAPNSALLGIPLLTSDGLLFGFSVDGVGDYNHDGNPDVIIGAPAGVSAGAGNLLGGSAYIFTGNGAGINTSFSIQLKASASLLNSVANLFGYSVRGIKNASGTRNGDALVGAPNGNLLSNILGGLQLKAGSVCVFNGKSGGPSTETPGQTITSPRSNSLLSILSGQTLNLSLLFGASIDNMLDVNCDGINDIIIGEPLSTSVGLIGADLIGGAATIFLGKADGTFNTTAYWTLENNVSMDAGINAGSLVGYSVAGVGRVKGAMTGVRGIVGAPGAALDFSSGIFNLGGTFGTLFSFVAGNNGLGKSYMFGYNDCFTTVPVNLSSFTVTSKNCMVKLNWESTQESNLKEYAVEYSVNGHEWEIIATLPAKNQNGSNYEFIRANSDKGSGYYRLALTDNRAIRSYSTVLKTTVSCKNNDIRISPNPFSEKITVSFYSEKSEMATVLLLNQSGKQVLSTRVFARAGRNQFNLSNLGWLSGGVYVLQITTSAAVLNHNLLK